MWFVELHVEFPLCSEKKIMYILYYYREMMRSHESLEDKRFSAIQPSSGSQLCPLNGKKLFK